MIITRSPLRITLAGGGTDLPSYYKEYGGYCISASINKYVYSSVLRPFTEGIYLKYSDIEKVNSVNEIKHPIIRECLKLLDLKTPQIEITTLADIPSGTGLGSSSSFTTGLLKALYHHRRKILTQKDLAELACEVEIYKLNSPIGKQDQYISTYGGITEFYFNTDDSVDVVPLNISFDTIRNLEDNLLLFFTGFSRNTNIILKEQNVKTIEKDKKMVDSLHKTSELAKQIKDVLTKGKLIEFGKLMDYHWNEKKSRSSEMTNQSIDEWYNYALKNGAIGGKLVGAGGGGFLMFYSSDTNRLREAMSFIGLEEVRFKFDFEGARVLV